MRLVAVAALAFALAACGDDGGAELAAGNSHLNQAQIDAALGPADQSAVQDAIPSDNAQEPSARGQNVAGEDDAAAPAEEDEGE